MLAGRKLSNIESITSKVLVNNQISHENFMTNINEEGNYRELNERVRMMKVQENKIIDTD